MVDLRFGHGRLGDDDHVREEEESNLCATVGNPAQGERRTRYGVIVTGVPSSTELKKSSAMNSGIRMQPCEAG